MPAPAPEPAPVPADGAAWGGAAASAAAPPPVEPVAAPAPVPVKPQPALPFSVATALAAQAPLGPLQHPEAQSASDRHCPVMNCWPLPAPTFEDVPDPAPPPLPAAASMDGAAWPAPWDAAGAAAAPPSPKPHPVLPAWNWAPSPEQMPAPFRVAQQVEAQSLLLRQAPPMNWTPLPLPTFLSPDGSGVKGLGIARAEAATGVC